MGVTWVQGLERPPRAGQRMLSKSQGQWQSTAHWIQGGRLEARGQRERRMLGRPEGHLTRASWVDGPHQETGEHPGEADHKAEGRTPG